MAKRLGTAKGYNSKTNARSGPWSAAEKRRADAIRLLGNGFTVAAMCEAVGIQTTTYSAWRQRYPDFAAKVDHARGQGLKGVDRWRGDFTSFRKVYLGYDTYFHQQKIVQAIENSPAQSVSIVLVPPEHGKTTVIEDWMTFKICTDPNVRITIVSEGQPHARKIMRRVQARLSDTRSKLFADFGPFYEAGQERRGKPWQSDFFTVCRSDHDERDYTVEARGWRSAVAGTRTDYLIIDDVTSMRNMTSAVSIVATLRQDFFTRPGKTGHTIIVGTRVDVGDVYEQLLDATDDMGNHLITNSVVLPALDSDGRSLCPEMWDEESLERKRSIVGESVWWRNYQQKPQAAGDLTFSDDVLNKAKNAYINLGDKLDNSHTILCLDPALGGGNAVLAWNYNANKMRILDFRLDFGLARTEEILARIDEMANLYGPVEDLVIETMAFQKALADDDRIRALAEKHSFRVLPHLTGSGGHSKLDEALGVGAMGTDMNKGLIEIPWGSLETRTRMDALIGEFKTWRPGVKGTKLRQDLVMATWFGWILMKNRRKVLETMATTDGWKRQALTSYTRPTVYQALRTR